MKRNGSRGFMLIEALVALVVVSLGLLGISRLHGYVFEEMAHTNMRVEAMALAESTLDRLRNESGGVPSSMTVNGRSGEYAVDVAVDLLEGNGDPNLRKIRIGVSWEDRRGQDQEVVIARRVAWDNPAALGFEETDSGRIDDILPVGQARRGEGFDVAADLENVSVEVSDADDVTRLVDSDGNELLYLEAFEGNPQSFVIIQGRVFLDDDAAIDESAIDVRLSNEGRCLRSRASEDGTSEDGTIDYECYVGPGWYGNIGVIAQGLQVCTGTGGVSDGSDWTTSHHPHLGSVRQYRGFVTKAGELVFRGVGRNSEYPPDGVDPQAETAEGSWQHNFLVTRLRGNQTCAGRIEEVTSGFDDNYGANVCIYPVLNAESDEVLCPVRWRNLLVNGLVHEDFESANPEDVSVSVLGEQGQCSSDNIEYACEFSEGLSGGNVTLRNSGFVNGEKLCFETDVSLPKSYTQFNLTEGNVEACASE